MKLFSLRPTRQEFKDADIVSDLDKLISEPTAFRFQGRTHLIKPITTEDFFKLSNALARLDALKEAKNVQASDLIDAYTQLVTNACDTINRADVESMTQAQVGALFQLILDVITGRVHAEKKNITDRYPSSSPPLPSA